MGPVLHCCLLHVPRVDLSVFVLWGIGLLKPIGRHSFLDGGFDEENACWGLELLAVGW